MSTIEVGCHVRLKNRSHTRLGVVTVRAGPWCQVLWEVDNKSVGNVADVNNLVKIKPFSYIERQLKELDNI